jgi:hypothetical protein
MGKLGITNSSVIFEGFSWKKPDRKLQYSCAYHSQTDEQKELVNESLKHLLQSIVGE